MTRRRLYHFAAEVADAYRVLLWMVTALYVLGTIGSRL